MCLAVPGKIITVTRNGSVYRVGRVDFGGIIKDVNLSYVPEAGVGDYVIVHVGFAISRLDADEAAQVFRYLKEIDAMEEVKNP